MPQLNSNKDGFTVSSLETERAALVELVELFQQHGSNSSSTTMAITFNDRTVRLPDSVSETLVAVSRLLADGEDLSVIAARTELTTGEAAQLLSVSRQYLVRLCEDGKLPFRMEGAHRRLALRDVLAYRTQRDEERSRMFRDHVRKAAEAGEYELLQQWPSDEQS